MFKATKQKLLSLSHLTGHFHSIRIADANLQEIITLDFLCLAFPTDIQSTGYIESIARSAARKIGLLCRAKHFSRQNQSTIFAGFISATSVLVPQMYISKFLTKSEKRIQNVIDCSLASRLHSICYRRKFSINIFMEFFFLMSFPLWQIGFIYSNARLGWKLSHIGLLLKWIDVSENSILKNYSFALPDCGLLIQHLALRSTNIFRNVNTCSNSNLLPFSILLFSFRSLQKRFYILFHT